MTYVTYIIYYILYIALLTEWSGKEDPGRKIFRRKYVTLLALESVPSSAPQPCFFPASFLPLRKPQMVYFLTQATQGTPWGCLKLPRPGGTLKPALINLLWGPGTCLFRSSPGALFVWSASGNTALIIFFRRVKISYRFPLQGLRTMEEKI